MEPVTERPWSISDLRDENGELHVADYWKTEAVHTGDEDSAAVWSEFHFARIQHKPARDAIRQAVANAKQGPVWLVNRDGKRVGAIATEADAAFLREVRRSLHEAETGQTADLGSFTQAEEAGP
jgi:hypothetical protein